MVTLAEKAFEEVAGALFEVVTLGALAAPLVLRWAIFSEVLITIALKALS